MDAHVRTLEALESLASKLKDRMVGAFQEVSALTPRCVQSREIKPPPRKARLNERTAGFHKRTKVTDERAFSCNIPRERATILQLQPPSKTLKDAEIGKTVWELTEEVAESECCSMDRRTFVHLVHHALFVSESDLPMGRGLRVTIFSRSFTKEDTEWLLRDLHDMIRETSQGLTVQELQKLNRRFGNLLHLLRSLPDYVPYRDPAALDEFPSEVHAFMAAPGNFDAATFRSFFERWQQLFDVYRASPLEEPKWFVDSHALRRVLFEEIKNGRLNVRLGRVVFFFPMSVPKEELARLWELSEQEHLKPYPYVFDWIKQALGKTLQELVSDALCYVRAVTLFCAKGEEFRRNTALRILSERGLVEYLGCDSYPNKKGVHVRSHDAWWFRTVPTAKLVTFLRDVGNTEIAAFVERSPAFGFLETEPDERKEKKTKREFCAEAAERRVIAL